MVLYLPQKHTKMATNTHKYFEKMAIFVIFISHINLGLVIFGPDRVLKRVFRDQKKPKNAK